MKKYKLIFLISTLVIFFFLSVSAQTEIPTEEEFFEIIKTQGIARAVEVFRTVKKNHPEAIIFRERALNSLGYQYLNSRKIEDALGIFKLNIEAYPEAFNTYDS